MTMRISHLPFLGYGFLEAWVLINFFLGERGTLLAGPLSTQDLLFSLPAVGIVATLICCALCSKRLGSIYAHPKTGWICAVIVCLLSLANLFCHALEVNFTLLLLASIGNAWLWLSWGEIYSLLSTESAERMSGASAVFEVLLVLSCMLFPSPARGIIASFFPILGYFFFRKAYETACSSNDEQLLSQEEKCEVKFGSGFALRFALGMGIINLVLFAFVRISLVGDGQEANFGAAAAVGLLLFLVFLVLIIKLTPSFDLPPVFFCFALALVAATLLVGFGAPAFAAKALILAAWLSVDQVIWLCLARIYRQGFSDAIRTFAAGQTVIYVGMIIGYLLGVFTYSLLQDGAMELQGICLATVSLLFVTAAIVSSAGRNGGTASITSEHTPEQLGFNESLRLMAERFALSPRETDVFLLFAKGRSASFIRDELFISESTVRSHIRHIYEKLGVSGKQQMFDEIQRFISF